MANKDNSPEVVEADQVKYVSLAGFLKVLMAVGKPKKKSAKIAKIIAIIGSPLICQRTRPKKPKPNNIKS